MNDPDDERDYAAEEIADLRDEIDQERDDWARSDEEGWFYGDE